MMMLAHPWRGGYYQGPALTYEFAGMGLNPGPRNRFAAHPPVLPHCRVKSKSQLQFANTNDFENFLYSDWCSRLGQEIAETIRCCMENLNRKSVEE